MVTLSLLLICFGITIFFYLKLPKFGKLAKGEQKERIHVSPNFREGKFQNIHVTPDLTDGATLFSVLTDQFFGKDKNNIPKHTIPSQKISLSALDPKENLLVWFGHSSYFLQLDGKRFLIDPVLSGNASPIPGTVKAFKGTSLYTPDDIPAIDYLLLTHDHWDHMDYDTLKKLQPRVKRVVTGLGNAAHLEYWGFDPSIIDEKDWNESVVLENGFTIHTTPARHFSGRTLKRQQSIWLSFVLQTPSCKLFLGGDSGYDTHFKEIGEKYGPFDLALLECGQYNTSWKFIHMLPEQVVEAAIDLGSKRLMPVHWGKFALAFHAWDEPVKRVVKAAQEKQVPILIPMIGEKVSLDDMPQEFPKWWEEVNTK